MSPRPPRKMPNRVTRSGPRKKLYPMSVSEKIVKLKDAVKRMEEAQKNTK